MREAQKDKSPFASRKAVFSNTFASISFEFVEGEAILLMVTEHGIGLDVGVPQSSHVLRAMGVPFTMAHGSMRFSLSVYDAEEEIDFVIDKFPPIIERRRSMSPYRKVGEGLRKIAD